MAKNKGGRPSEMSEEKVKKLEEVFALDGTIEEACYYADISKPTYYEWLKKKPELSNRFEALRNRPVLKARGTVVKALDNPVHAFEYLKRKRKSEFSERLEQTGADGQELPTPIIQLNVSRSNSNKKNSEPVKKD